MTPNRMECPKCGMGLKSDKPLSVGRSLTCPNCGARLSIDARVQGVRWRAIFLVLLVVVVLLGGGALATYFAGLWPGATQQAAADTDKKQDDKDKKDDKEHKGDQPEQKKKPDPPELIPDESKPKTKKKDSPLSHQQQLAVDRAIAFGVTYLKAAQFKDGSWKAEGDTLPDHIPAISALAALTLLECDVPKTDPVVQKAAAYLRGLEASPRKLQPTYDVALALLFLDRLGDARDADLIRTLALRIVAGQRASGGWNYDCEVLTPADAVTLGQFLEKTRTSVTADVSAGRLGLQVVDPAQVKLDGGAALPDNLKGLAVWRADVPTNGVDSDNSNTQFAVLALWAAKVRGIPVQRALARVVQRFHQSQNPDGSWGYETAGGRKATAGDRQPPDAMTCAGLLGLAVGQGLVNEARGATTKGRKPAAEQDPAIGRGLDYLGKAVGNPNRPWENASSVPLVNLYYLWSVERVGVIFGVDRIGGKDWYGWGAEILTIHQTIQGDQGHWPTGNFYGQHPTVNTCLALLFLKRANLARDLSRRLVIED